MSVLNFLDPNFVSEGLRITRSIIRRGVSLAELNKQLEGGNLDPKEVATAQAGQARDYPNVSFPSL